MIPMDSGILFPQPSAAGQPSFAAHAARHMGFAYTDRRKRSLVDAHRGTIRRRPARRGRLGSRAEAVAAAEVGTALVQSDAFESSYQTEEGFMKKFPRIFLPRIIVCIASFWGFATYSTAASRTEQEGLCLDGFCIGQSIHDARFDKVAWIVPQKDLVKEICSGVGCQPDVAFRGYANEDKVKLAETVSWKYGLNNYNIVTKADLGTLRKYKYECNPSARGMWGERRFFGVYRSIPSQYLTVIGLRLISGALTVYRIARQYPYRNQNELVSLAKKLGLEYGNRVLLYDHLSSNAYSDVIEQHKDGWFARSTLFNTTDLSDNAAELVLIDPQTRNLLQPTDMPESGEIKPLAVNLSQHCSRSLPIQ